MEFVLIWIVCGVIAAMIGSRKGEGCGAFIVGVIFGPFGILFALVSEGNRKNCHFCKELMHEEATVCPHCQREQIKKVKEDSKGDATARNNQEADLLTLFSKQDRG